MTEEKKRYIVTFKKDYEDNTFFLVEKEFENNQIGVEAKDEEEAKEIASILHQKFILKT